MVDLTRHRDGKGKTRVRARLLDLVPVRSGAAYAEWLKARHDAFRTGIAVATLDPFHGYENAIDDVSRIAAIYRPLNAVRSSSVFRICGWP